MERISWFGVALISFGIPLMTFSFFVFSRTGITAFGLACAIMGGVLVLTPWSPVPEPPVKSMVEGSCVNVEALLEEADARGRAVYLPPNEGQVYAFVPIESDPEFSDFADLATAPKRIVTEIAGVPGLTVFPPGSEIVRSSSLGREMGLEAALHHVMVDFIEAVEGVQALREGDEIRVRFSNPQIDTDHPRFRKSLGSLPVSLAASVISHALNSPVRIVEERPHDDEIEAVFEVMSENG